jgi:hypothetical protein
MADDNERGGAGRGAKEARQDRLKLALRENLKRRKAQARGRAVAEPAGEEAARRGLDGSGNSPDFCRNRGSE